MNNKDKKYITTTELYKFTLLFAFIVLTFSGIITGIEAFKTLNLQYRIALTIETFVSLVAGYIYYKYLVNSKENSSITGYRYLDWFITTPFLLFSLCVVLYGQNLLILNEPFPWYPFIFIVVLNTLMILFGYLSEVGLINKYLGWIVATLALIAIFVIIYYYFKPNLNPVYWFFVVLWGLYGLVFFFPEDIKGIFFNILDVIAKAGFGIWTFLFSVQLVQPIQ